MLVGNREESDGGQFPSHPGRPGPETSSEGAHLTPNPQEIQAGLPPTPSPSFSPHPSIHPSLLLLGGRKAPINSKHLYGQGPIRGPPFPEPAQMKFYSLHEKITGGGGEKTENKVKQTVWEDQGGEEMRGKELVIRDLPSLFIVFIRRRQYYVLYGWSLVTTTV